LAVIMSRGPLNGVRVVELGGIGPVPFAGMLLSDLGADVVRIDRTIAGPFGAWSEPRFDILARGRRSVAVDLKNKQGREVVLRIVERADALIEGFRPGVAERLQLGPTECLGCNERLVYGRMTGWGQEGPLASTAGHDIDYIALTGALHAIGSRGGGPAVPLNLIGDFGGGALYLALGVVSAVLHARVSGQGQVVDAAMVDGAGSLMAAIYGAHAIGFWRDERGSNLLDGAAPFYRVYETADRGYVAVGAIEPQFYAALVRGLGLDAASLPGQLDRDSWGEVADRFAKIFRGKTRDEWCEVFSGTDACVAPVLSLGEAPTHEHARARRAFVEIDGVPQPAPAPRFSATQCGPPSPPVRPGTHTRAVLMEVGYAAADVDAMLRAGVVAAAD
jgi:alpha-methylacyl-CoA racemase